MEGIRQVRRATSAGVMQCRKAVWAANGDVLRAIEEVLADRPRRSAESTQPVRYFGHLNPARTEGCIIGLQGVEFPLPEDVSGLAPLAARLLDAAHRTAILEPSVLQVICDDVLSNPAPGIGQAVKLQEVRVFSAPHGIVELYVHHDHLKAAMIEGGISPGRTANVDEVHSLFHQICIHIVGNDPPPGGFTEASILPHLITTEQRHVVDQLMEDGKPREIAEKIALGRQRAFCEDHALLRQPLVMLPHFLIEQLLGDNLYLKRFVRFPWPGVVCAD